MNSPELIDQLKKIWVLDTLIEEGSFSRAAAKTKVTRSAISQTISHLEKAYRKVLLVRERGSVRPTPYCLELLSKARPLLKSLEDLRVERSAPVPLMSWLDMGAYESLAVTLMPALLKTLQLKCPGIKVTVKIARSGKLATLVRKGELCMAIVIENDLTEGLSVLPVGEERLGYYVSAALPVKRRNWSAVSEMPVGDLLSGTDGSPRYHSQFLKASALPVLPSFTSDSLEAILAATAHGSIVGILPRRVAARSPTPLVEITPPALIQKGIGRHKICLISRQNCDPEENEFLAAELRRLLSLPESSPIASL